MIILISLMTSLELLVTSPHVVIEQPVATQVQIQLGRACICMLFLADKVVYMIALIVQAIRKINPDQNVQFKIEAVQIGSKKLQHQTTK
ncbi:unnamed protein product [Paramecium octaurelia]|uniref:Secreted protein n=1 Tax=Paramecium octaurelia TaxID=43137 RepID=A0A8S1U0F9_PAROT|nr:unnamed protein product [Paramecium octaurelia]